MTAENLFKGQFEVKKGAKARVEKLGDKVLDLSVRTTDITSDVVRAGSYMLQNGHVLVDGYNIEIETYIHDVAAESEYDGTHPRFALGIVALGGKYDIEGEKPSQQKPYESIYVSGGRFEETMTTEVGDMLVPNRPKFPLIFEYRAGDGDEYMNLAVNPENENETQELIAAIVLTFWAKYGLDHIVASMEMWEELHLTDEQRFDRKYPVSPQPPLREDHLTEEENDDLNAWADSLADVTPADDDQPEERYIDYGGINESAFEMPLDDQDAPDDFYGPEERA